MHTTPKRSTEAPNPPTRMHACTHACLAPQRSVARSPSTLLVKNLPFSADEDELAELFGRAGAVRRRLGGGVSWGGVAGGGRGGPDAAAGWPAAPEAGRQGAMCHSGAPATRSSGARQEPAAAAPHPTLSPRACFPPRSRAWCCRPATPPKLSPPLPPRPQAARPVLPPTQPTPSPHPIAPRLRPPRSRAWCCPPATRWRWSSTRSPRMRGEARGARRQGVQGGGVGARRALRVRAGRGARVRRPPGLLCGPAHPAVTAAHATLDLTTLHQVGVQGSCL